MTLRIIGALLTVIVFNLVAMGVLAALTPSAGLMWVLFLTVAFYAWSVRAGRNRRARLARLRLRPPDGPPQWILVSVAATLFLMLGISSFITIIAPEIDAADMPQWYEMLRPYRDTPIGWAALTLLIAFAVPMVEEFSFRGHILRTLERRFGATAAILATALLFMALHVGGPHWSFLGVSLTLGIACGMAVYAFRSIWAAVLLHSAWNGGMMAGEALGSDTAAAWPAAGASAYAAAGLILIALGAFGWLAVLRATARRVRQEVSAAFPSA